MTKNEAMQMLSNLKDELQAWRSQKGTSRLRIPEDLWQKAVSLHPCLTIGRICKALSLGHSGFLKRITKANAITSAETGSALETPAFMNISLAQSMTAFTCLIEYISVDGRQMKVHLQTISGDILKELISVYFGMKSC
jgi:hypothetical protein